MRPNQDDKLLEVLFPQDWYCKVLQAVDFALNRIPCDMYHAKQLAKEIIDYNIHKRVQEMVEESAEYLLPKTLNWSKLSLKDALDSFRVILDACDLCDDLLSYTAELKLGKNTVVYNELLIAKECIHAKYPNLTVDLLNTEKKNVFLLQVKKSM